MSTGAILSIHCAGLAGRHATICLNGQDISSCTQSIELSVPCDGIVRAVLKISVEELVVSTETLLMLQAFVQSKEADGAAIKEGA